MTQEEKQLLLKDLSARSLCGVKAEVMGWDEEKEEEVLVPVTVYSVNTDGYVYFADNDYDITYCSIDACRLYLRPMSGMTDKEKDELYTAMDWYGETDEAGNVYTKGQEKVYRETFYEYTDWLNEHHFDYRGLIEKGLALEAPEGMYENN